MVNRPVCFILPNPGLRRFRIGITTADGSYAAMTFSAESKFAPLVADDPVPTESETKAPPFVPHQYMCVDCGARRALNERAWIIRLFCDPCRRKTNHKRMD